MTLLKAKAKINLFFHITGKRDDGYHLIESLVVFTDDVYDIVEITTATTNSTEVVGGGYAHLLQFEKNNLIDKVLHTFTTHQKFKCKLTKDIPIGAGLGGGSADAATIAKFLSTQIPNQELAKIGADLPVCYLQQPTYCFGIGEILEPVTDFPKLYVVLVNPRKELLTKDVFANNNIVNSIPIIDKPLSFFNTPTKLIDFLAKTNNVLTEAAFKFVPEINEILQILNRQIGCEITRMSGSGPTCFGVFTEKIKAIEAQKNISKTYPEFWVKYSTI